MKITSAEQFETLIAELEKSPCLAKGLQKGTAPANFKQQWEAISSKLNALGPPLRDSDGWQKVIIITPLKHIFCNICTFQLPVWRDYKFKVKKKLIKNKAECNATDGGMYKQLTLCPLEEAVANLLQFNKQLSPEGVLQGVQLPPAETQHQTSSAVEFAPLDGAQIIECILLCPPDLPCEEEEPTTSASARSRNQPSTPVRTRKPKTSERNDLLERHNSMQERILTDATNKMGSMKHSLRDTAGYQKKLLAIEEKKLKLLEKRDRREVELHKAAMQLKEIKLEIAKEKLRNLKKS
ncbi:PREDICTED: uncharacterized protein LOC108359153 [Rhagoletis zephyria]|uniref:uncharacterized protein LOC108359153 n=1 Tax=Rhagoletis zephyria TaxID=28612 RepID=UPI0008114A91|nr:PREDICTED: uncharacterized protein LOC108359153 [Rhagoletis zephyria]XP_017466346.1 PREDICTED: uncharacterized protein LOC108359153 [Rhagoletis zephyria]XP_017466347.1 PREDICTED: uncharacterized protein LOC108359153 [Rhagoletis zephyria]